MLSFPGSLSSLCHYLSEVLLAFYFFFLCSVVQSTELIFFSCWCLFFFFLCDFLTGTSVLHFLFYCNLIPGAYLCGSVLCSVGTGVFPEKDPGRELGGRSTNRTVCREPEYALVLGMWPYCKASRARALCRLSEVQKRAQVRPRRGGHPAAGTQAASFLSSLTFLSCGRTLVFPYRRAM